MRKTVRKIFLKNVKVLFNILSLLFYIYIFFLQILGTREIIAELDEVQPNGKMFKKYQLGDYRWITYEGLDVASDEFGRGLRALGLQPRQKMAIFADTRAEWMITAQAAFKHAFPLCTLYTNLGVDAVVYGLNQTQVNIILLK